MRGFAIDAVRIRDRTEAALGNGALDVALAQGEIAVAAGQLRLANTAIRAKGAELGVSAWPRSVRQRHRCTADLVGRAGLRRARRHSPRDRARVARAVRRAEADARRSRVHELACAPRHRGKRQAHRRAAIRPRGPGASWRLPRSRSSRRRLWRRAGQGRAGCAAASRRRRSALRRPKLRRRRPTSDRRRRHDRRPHRSRRSRNRSVRRLVPGLRTYSARNIGAAEGREAISSRDGPRALRSSEC